MGIAISFNREWQIWLKVLYTVQAPRPKSMSLAKINHKGVQENNSSADTTRASRD